MVVFVMQSRPLLWPAIYHHSLYLTYIAFDAPRIRATRLLAVQMSILGH